MCFTVQSKAKSTVFAFRVGERIDLRHRHRGGNLASPINAVVLIQNATQRCATPKRNRSDWIGVLLLNIFLKVLKEWQCIRVYRFEEYR